MKPGRDSASVRLKLYRTAALLTWVAVSLLPSFGLAQQSAAPKRVLVLHWYDKDHFWNVNFDRGFQAALRTASAETVEYYPEYLESNRFPGENQSRLLRDYLQQKYADRNIDVVVANSDTSLEFLFKYRDDLFSNIPIVFVATRNPTTEELAAGPGITGIINLNTYRETFDLALNLHPGTEQVFVISGTLQRDKKFEMLAREELQGYERRVRVTYLTDLPLNELIAKVKSLPQRSLIFYIWQQSQNESGKILETVDILTSIAQSTPAPIYAMAFLMLWDSRSENLSASSGIVGGYANPPAATGTKAAEIVLRIANGERAHDIPVELAPTAAMFDWRQLRRWGISEDKLPPGSIVRFKVCIVQALLILALLTQRIRRRRAEQALRENQERLERTEDFSLVMATHVGLDGRWLRVPPTLCELLGHTEEELLAGYFKDVTHPDDFEADWSQCQRLIRGEIKSFDLEKRYIHKDGHIIWVYLNCSIVTDAKGKPVHFLTYIRDITRRKQAEEQLNLLQTITVEVAAAGDLASAFEVVLRCVCETTGWVLGQVWFPREDGTVLDCGPAWSGSASGLEAFRVASEGITFPPGVGLPGRAWSSQQAAWVEDVTLDANLANRQAGKPSLHCLPVIAGLQFRNSGLFI
jgi:PAS domain S-box-containing protein